MNLTLVQFRWSHYNEKARWALDYKGITHQRRTLLPGLHGKEATQLTGQTQLPILIVDGKAVNDSTRIIDTLERLCPDPPLYPTDPDLCRRALELEEYFDEELGPHIRRMLMAACLSGGMRYMAHLFDVEASLPKQWLYRSMLSWKQKPFARLMKLDAETVKISSQKVAQAVTRLEQEIQPNGYLVGSGFSVADLTAAAMLSVAVRPQEMDHPLSLRPPPSVMELERSFANRPAAKWVREIYRRHRPRWLRKPAASRVGAHPGHGELRTRTH